MPALFLPLWADEAVVGGAPCVRAAVTPLPGDAISVEERRLLFRYSSSVSCLACSARNIFPGTDSVVSLSSDDVVASSTGSNQ